MTLLKKNWLVYFAIVSLSSYAYGKNLHTTLGVCPALNDSTLSKKARPVRRYIRPTIFTNYYTTSKRDIVNNTKFVSYNFSQYNMGFYFPFYTNTWLRNDSSTLANIHLLATGSVLAAMPYFSGLEEQYMLYKGSVGVRAIYNTGRKNIWFFHISPFFSQDDNTISKPTGRFSSVFLYNRTVNKNFSYRLGMLKTFLFGDRYYLPVIGFRIGPLDGTYFSVQLPKHISLNFPIGKKLSTSIFIKPVGGLYTISNINTNFIDKGSIVQFGRKEFLNGFLLNYRVNNNISTYFSAGIANTRFISFAVSSGSTGYLESFFSKEIEPTAFFNLGLTIRFGKSIKSYNNINMYDVFDLNNQYDPSDENFGPQNDDIPRITEKDKIIKNIQYKDVEDLISEFDLY